MTDIPEYLIDAWQGAPESIVETIAAVLAALRPEDAHLIPAWDEVVNGEAWERGQREREEARAEYDWLKSEMAQQGVYITRLRAERDEARADAANLAFWKAEATEARAELNAALDHIKQLNRTMVQVRAEADRLREQYEPAIVTAEHSAEGDYRHELEREVARLTRENQTLRIMTGSLDA